MRIAACAGLLPAQADFIIYKTIDSLPVNLPCCFSCFDVIIAKALISYCIVIRITSGLRLGRSKMDEIRELQMAALGILVDVDRFCRDNNIAYFLGEGTLLGAVRHNGFIPWDDDVDLIMKRADYQRFLKIAPRSLGSKYEVQHASTVENYWSPFIKVRLIDCNDNHRQRHIAHLTKNNGPCVDIFPMEFVPEEKSMSQTLQSKEIRFLRGMLSFKLGLRKPKNFKQRIIHAFSALFTVKEIHRRLDRAFNRYNSSPTEFIATLSSYHKLECQTVPAKVYDNTVYMNFEGYQLPVPGEYDFLLRKIYGDYMTLPPEEERAIKHHFVLGDGH